MLACGTVSLLEVHPEPEPPLATTGAMVEWMNTVRDELRSCNVDKQTFRTEMEANILDLEKANAKTN
ncbi:MAG: hypothetical protein GQ570_04040 [Helicobacteraceae bacterium]|nr:hypothetical protein [Helicobacteraceae bacterium]